MVISVKERIGQLNHTVYINDIEMFKLKFSPYAVEGLCPAVLPL
jgi:hypothetical protein